ncbi:MAG: hypothetical protein ACREUC_08975 [Steroidobacteraceae bacterium]
MPVLRRIPILIALLFAIDIALAIFPLVDFWAGSPFNRLRNVFNLDREHTIPTWYSSMQWFCAAALFALFAAYAYRSRLRGWLPVAAIALMCLAFSVDEITAIHEFLGMISDRLFQGGTRQGTALWNTGMWPLVIGIPVLIVVAVLVHGTRQAFAASASGALWKLIAGLAIMFTGALVIELGANLISVVPDSRGLVLGQVVLEEFLEMLGVTFIVWSGYELLAGYGFELTVPAVASFSPNPRPAPSASASARSAYS